MLSSGYSERNSERKRERNLVDPYHIDEFNELISRLASLKDKELQISRGVDRLTPKVCNTAMRLAREDNDIPLNRIDQAISMNFANPDVVKQDMDKLIASRMNLGQAFRYPELYPFDQTRKRDLVPRKIPGVKKLLINFDYAMEALYEQELSPDSWNIIINHKWFEMSTDPYFKLVPEMLPSGSHYSTTAGVVNIQALFDMEAVRKQWQGPINIFNPECVDILSRNVRTCVRCPDEDGVMHEYEIEWTEE